MYRSKCVTAVLISLAFSRGAYGEIERGEFGLYTTEGTPSDDHSIDPLAPMVGGGKGMPSVWEGGTNVVDPSTWSSNGQQDVSTQTYARTSHARSRLQNSLQDCATVAVTLSVPQGTAGQLTFVPDDCVSPLSGDEIWTWPTGDYWPDEFEIRPDLPLSRPLRSWHSWAFPSEPFDLEQSGPWLQDIELLPEDRLYQVERVDNDGAEVIAWFWFQAGDTWNQVAFANVSVAELYLSMDAGGFLRFTALDTDELPTWIWVNQAGSW